jgi:hypothetical protein
LKEINRIDRIKERQRVKVKEALPVASVLIFAFSFCLDPVYPVHPV